MERKVIKNYARLFLENNSIEHKTLIEDYYKTLVYKNKSQASKVTGISYLGSINGSAKIIKGTKLNYNTYIMYMAPHTMSGYNTCAKASEGCSSACLNTSGRVKMDYGIVHSRILRTWLFYSNREFFNAWLFAEIESAIKTTISKGLKFSARLNGTTDLDISLFNHQGVNVLDRFSEYQFYDYTKIYKRLDKYKDTKNYHLTFSHSGENDEEVDMALSQGFNVAVPFYVQKGRQLPNVYKGYEVGDGDITDLRFLDENPICGLRVKIVKDKSAIGKAIDNGFIIV
jgi:hypothetical protein